jgi:hypothetical protein
MVYHLPQEALETLYAPHESLLAIQKQREMFINIPPQRSSGAERRQRLLLLLMSW